MNQVLPRVDGIASSGEIITPPGFALSAALQDLKGLDSSESIMEPVESSDSFRTGMALCSLAHPFESDFAPDKANKRAFELLLGLDLAFNIPLVGGYSRPAIIAARRSQTLGSRQWNREHSTDHSRNGGLAINSSHETGSLSWGIRASESRNTRCRPSACEPVSAVTYTPSAASASECGPS